MADKTKIEWTDATWNPITGCSVVSPGCTNCYAMRLAGTRMKHHWSRKGLTIDTKAGPVWNGEVRFNGEWLDQPLRWRRRRRVFVCAHGDLFHEDVPDAWIDMVFGVMASSRHTFQILTKRPDRMARYVAGIAAGGAEALRRYLDDPEYVASCRARAAMSPPRLQDPPPPTPELRSLYDRAIAALHSASLMRDERTISNVSLGEYHWQPWPLRNVWLGVSIEDQPRADERRSSLKAIADLGWLTWVSYEPALGPVDWSGWDFIRWLVSGGENGPRPSHPDWHRAARDFCAPRGIPYYFKQWGSCLPGDMSGEDERGRAAYVIDEEFCGADYDDLGRGTYVRAHDHDFIRFSHKRTGALLDGREHREFPR